MEVLGSGGVGKSSITIQYIQGIFVERYDPTLEDSYIKETHLDNTQYFLEILDTAGTEQFTAMRSNYFSNNSDGFILIYAINALSTFRDIKTFKEQIERRKDCDVIPVVLVGNKCDLVEERVVSTAQGEALAGEIKAEFVEASAKFNVNVERIFEVVLRLIVEEKGRKMRELHRSLKGGCYLL
uniref:Uncharacterized protein n=1 Tax=Arcella intermedia TaxID=1963864 RepID=A0A6B2LKW3_9EUKA